MRPSTRCFEPCTNLWKIDLCSAVVVVVGWGFVAVAGWVGAVLAAGFPPPAGGGLAVAVGCAAAGEDWLGAAVAADGFCSAGGAGFGSGAAGAGAGAGGGAGAVVAECGFSCAAGAEEVAG